jgi:hypothetical protein
MEIWNILHTSQYEEMKSVSSKPRYSWNTAKVGIKHQSINQSFNHSIRYIPQYPSLTVSVSSQASVDVTVKPLGSRLAFGIFVCNYKDKFKPFLLCNQCLSPLMLWVRISIRASCTTLCDKVCQWLATGRWFSPGPPVSSTNKARQI